MAEDKVWFDRRFFIFALLHFFYTIVEYRVLVDERFYDFILEYQDEQAKEVFLSLGKSDFIPKTDYQRQIELILSGQDADFNAELERIEELCRNEPPFPVSENFKKRMRDILGGSFDSWSDDDELVDGRGGK